jgi:hypothetical protein
VLGLDSSLAGRITYNTNSPNILHIFTFDAAGSAVDTAFSVTMFNLS